MNSQTFCWSPQGTGTTQSSPRTHHCEIAWDFVNMNFSIILRYSTANMNANSAVNGERKWKVVAPFDPKSAAFVGS